MTRVLLDTNAYSAFKAGDAPAIEAIRKASWIGISSVVVGELLGGFALGTKAQRNRRELGAFLRLPQVAFLPVTDATAFRYGALYAELRRKGKPIPTNDMWIAASALEHDFTLFSYDAHFARVGGLKRLVPSKRP